MALRLLCAAAALVVAPATVAAPSAPDTLDLARAVAFARAHNPMLAARTAEVRAAAARLGPAGAWPDPTLSLGAMNYVLPTLSPSGDPMTMNQVTLMQPVPIGGAPGRRRAAARADSVRFAALQDAAALEIEQRTRTAYWSVYHADRALEVMQQRLSALRDMADAVRTMYGVGSAQQVDVLRAQAAVTRLGQDITQMQLERRQAAATLNEALGRPADDSVVLTPAGERMRHEAMPSEMPPLPTFDSLAVLAEAHSPVLRAAAAGLDAARASAAAANRERLPDLGVGIAYGQRSRNADMVSLMVSVNLPVFAHAKQNQVRNEALALADAAAHDLEATRQRIRAALERSRAEAETARDLVRQYAGTLVPQATAALEAALASYRVGRSDIAMVLDAQTMLLEYEHDLHRFEAMYGTAVAELDDLTGRPYAEEMP